MTWGEDFYQYDSRNRLTSHTVNDVTEAYTYDNAGNLLKDGKNQYSYDAFDRTSKVETFDGNIQINRYDAEGLRYEMEENGNLVQFIFRGDEIVAEKSKEDILLCLIIIIEIYNNSNVFYYAKYLFSFHYYVSLRFRAEFLQG